MEGKNQEKGKQGLKILFCMPNGGIEIKYINKTLVNVLEGSKLWRKHGRPGTGGKSLRLEHLEDTDSEVEDQDRKGYEGRSKKPA